MREGNREGEEERVGGEMKVCRVRRDGGGSVVVFFFKQKTAYEILA